MDRPQAKVKGRQRSKGPQRPSSKTIKALPRPIPRPTVQPTCEASGRVLGRNRPKPQRIPKAATPSRNPEFQAQAARKSSLKRAARARVLPQAGHGSPVRKRKRHPERKGNQAARRSAAPGQEKFFMICFMN